MATTERAVRAQNIVSRALSWFTNLFGRTGYWIMNLGTREVLPDMSQTAALDCGFNMNAAVYSIVKTDVLKFASIPRFVYDAKAMEQKQQRVMPMHLKAVAGVKRAKTNDLSKLLARPNPYQGQAAFFKTVRAYYKVEGEAFIWLNRGDMTGPDGRPLDDMTQDAKPVLEMYPLPPDQVTVVPDPENLFGVSGYILKVAGSSLPIRKGDIIHWKDINLKFDAATKDHLRGMTPLKPGRAVLQQNNDATLASTRMYQNDGAKGVLYAEDSKWTPTPTQQTQIQGVVDRKINNNDIKGAVANIMGAGKLGYIDLGGTSVDMQLLDGKKVSWQELCALMQVPYELFNTETTFANKSQAQEGWVSNTMIPACEELDDELNRVLLKAFKAEGQLIIAADFSKLPELQKNMKELAEWLERAYWIVPNEKREMMGYESYSDPLFDEPWMPNTITPLSEVILPDDGIGDLEDLSDYVVQDPAKKPQKQTV